MLAVVSFFAYVTWTLTSPTSVGADCEISIQYLRGDLKESQPLILRWNGSYTNFLYPEKDGILPIRTGDTIYLACPGKNNYLNNEFWGNEAEATCVQQKTFKLKGSLHEFSSLVCAKDSADSTRFLTEQNDVCKHTSIEIGFYVNNTFVRTIEICRNDWTYTTYYVKSQITKSIGSHQSGYPRPSRFKPGNFYKGINVDNLYKFDTQKESFTKILGSSKLVEGRLEKSIQFLSRGHLSAKSDFVYGSQQKSTFWFINVMPQWQTINGGNWKWLESNVQDLASKRQLELDVYTGIYGQMTMKDINGVQQPIYLYPEGQALPVPKYFWKVVYSPSRKQGVALVSLNDPFIESITSDLKICRDITKQITWLTWSPNDIKAGISYACTIDELRRRVPEVPNLLVTSLLK